MASIDKLFGTASGQKLANGLSKLFGGSSGPLDATKVKQKARTVLPDIKRPEAEAPKQDASGSVSRYDGSKTGEKRSLDAEPEAVQETKKISKRQKRKLEDTSENANLESEYYSKLLEKEETSDQETAKDQKDADLAEDSEQKPTAAKAASRSDMKEAELAKAERTVFVGNVPKDVVTSKALTKKFKKLFAIAKNASKPEVERDNEDNSKDKEEESDKDAFFAVESVRFRSISFEEALPRKVAFVQQKLHKSRDSVNAYVVYADKNAVKIACQKLNGCVFEDHHLRVDSVAHPTQHDNKRSVFVGNLDFEETEESLWKHFGKTGDIEYVRVVRDSKTNVGKGFAYVQFSDFQAVNKALLLDGQKLNGSGRKLRVTRCKTMRKAQAPTQSNGKPLTDRQKTNLGRAKKILGKADRSTAGKEITVEGLRATKGASAPILKKKKQRTKGGRVTKRSTAFKKANNTNQ
ncbi:LANO_0C02652g1_1 [Lachancea nothofagi CBS 11611]|uniref:Nucleolar protein 12 n=1 Tax=Lachancea nothofagi CBS 11611 TaxID=1266666 RepID=A0A1G4J506_9SACH|nr:LANO_0C02652g1_1 [Lachancea nothofagi CBS 11611]